jgi:hypothetical protein
LQGRHFTGRGTILLAEDEESRELIDRVDELAKLNDISRSEAVRRLLVHALPH